MPLTLLSACDSLDIYHDQDNCWLYLDWKGVQELEAVQAACQQVSACIQQTGTHKVLNDNSHVTQTTRELAIWVATVYLPEAGWAGIAYVAWVYSPVLYSRGDINLIAQLSTQEEPQIALFEDVASAYTWLSRVHLSVRQ